MSDRRKLTLGYLTLDTDPLTTVEAAAGAGFDAVGLRITGRRRADPYPDIVGRPETLREIRDHASGLGIRISNISAWHVYPDVEKGDLASVLDAVCALGADTVLANSYMDDESRFLDLFCAYAEMARERGVRVVIEFMRYSGIKSLARAADLVRRSGFDNAGMVVDALHLDRAGEAPSAIAAIDPGLVVLAQICDARLRPGLTDDELRAEARTARLYPGEGELPLREFLAALPPSAELEVETPRPDIRHLPPLEQAGRALQATRAFLDGMRVS